MCRGVEPLTVCDRPARAFKGLTVAVAESRMIGGAVLDVGHQLLERVFGRSNIKFLFVTATHWIHHATEIGCGWQRSWRSLQRSRCAVACACVVAPM